MKKKSFNFFLIALIAGSLLLSTHPVLAEDEITSSPSDTTLEEDQDEIIPPSSDTLVEETQKEASSPDETPDDTTDDTTDEIVIESEEVPFEETEESEDTIPTDSEDDEIAEPVEIPETVEEILNDVDTTTTTATTSIAIRLTLVATDAILYDGNVSVTPCPIIPDSTTTAYTAWCALEQIVASENLTVETSIFGSSIFISAINSYNGSDGNWWAFFYNDEFSNVAVNEYFLTENDHIYLGYGVMPMQLQASTTTLHVGDTVAITAIGFGFNSTTFAPEWGALQDVTWTMSDGTINTSSSLHISLSTTNTISITAEKTGYFLANPLVVTPENAIPVRLQIETFDGTFFDAEEYVTYCEESTSTINASCVLNQIAALNDWTIGTNNSGGSEFLDSISDYQTDFSAGLWWLWFHNLTFANEAINEYTASPNDELLFTFGISPLRVTVSTSPVIVGEPVTVEVQTFGFDESFNAAWLSTTDITVIQDEITTTSPNGIFTFVPETELTAIQFAKIGFVTTSVTITATTSSANSESVEAPADDTPGGCGSCAGGGGRDEFDVDQAMSFLALQQNTDGSFGNGTRYSDWVAIAFGAYTGQETAEDHLRAYLLSNPDPGSLATDYERRAMGLLALGINPYNGTATNYIQNITNTFDGTQIGQDDLVNDDIFAIFPLIKAGYAVNDPLIQSVTQFILDTQLLNGAWYGGVDVTAAAIQALSLVSSQSGVAAAMNNAKAYLENTQQNNGSFGTASVPVDSTSWTLQAIAALGESPNAANWQENGNSGLDYLATAQDTNGSVRDSSETLDNHIWSTAYAIPAALGKSWGEILTNFSLPTSNESVIQNPIARGRRDPRETPTSTQQPDLQPVLPSTTTTPSSTIESDPEILPLTQEIVRADSDILPQPISINIPTLPATRTSVSEINATEEVSQPTARADSSTLFISDTDTNEQIPTVTLSVPPANLQEKSTVTKNIFEGSVALAGTLGMYLAWRLAQTLL